MVGEPDDRGAAMPSAQNFELTRKRGHVFMKPVGAQAEKLVPYGARGDTRYGSPRTLRRVLAFAVDSILHLGAGLGAAIAIGPGLSIEAAMRFDWRHVGVDPVIAVGFWLTASATNRVIVQAIFHTTVGKALFGLRVIRPDNGAHPSFGKLLGVWLVDLYLLIAAPIALVTLSAIPGPDNIDDYLLPAVRNRDLRTTRTARELHGSGSGNRAKRRKSAESTTEKSG